MAFRPRKFRTWWQERGLKLACIWLVVTNVKMARFLLRREQMSTAERRQGRDAQMYTTHTLMNERFLYLPYFWNSQSLLSRGHT